MLYRTSYVAPSLCHMMRPQVTRIKRNYDCHGATNEEMRQRPTLLKRPEMTKTMGMLWIVILGYVKQLKIHVVCGSGTQAYDVYAQCCHENDSSLSMEQMILHLLSLSLKRIGSARWGKEIGYSSSIEASTSTRLGACDDFYVRTKIIDVVSLDGLVCPVATRKSWFTLRRSIVPKSFVVGTIVPHTVHNNITTTNSTGVRKHKKQKQKTKWHRPPDELTSSLSSISARMVDVPTKFVTCRAISERCHRPLAVVALCPPVHALEVPWLLWAWRKYCA